MDCTLFVNRQEAGSWQYGYTSFEFEISDFLVAGENTILLRVTYESPNSRWYTGAGIYRSVWIRECPLIHFIPDSIYISTVKENGCYELIISHELSQPEQGAVVHTLLNQEGRELLTGISSGQKVRIPDPVLWSPEKPYLYTLRSEVICDLIIRHITRHILTG